MRIFQPTITGSLNIVSGPLLVTAKNYVTAAVSITAFDLPPAIGQQFQGGKIGYVLTASDPGYDPAFIKGLIISDAPININTSNAPWGCSGTFFGTSGSFAIGTGQANTNIILAGCATSNIIARLADNYSSGSYTDWYLPSINELGAILVNYAALGITTGTGVRYATSTEYNVLAAYTFNWDGATSTFKNIYNNATYAIAKTTTGVPTIAIRSFSVPISKTVISGSLFVTNGITGNLSGTASYVATSSYAVTASYANSAATSSYAVTASYALNGGSGGSGTGFPFTGSAVITGSLTIAGYPVIGQYFQGGKIAYILTSSDAGYDPNYYKGIIAAETDLPRDYAWDPTQNGVITSATGSAIGTGQANTTKIINVLGSENAPAASASDAYAAGGYSDWYLPSKAELNKLYINKEIIGGFNIIGYPYWSSTEYDGYNAWYQYFDDGSQVFEEKYTYQFARPVRSFSIPITDFAGSITVSGSINVTNGVTGSLLGTSSYAVTASYALNGGGGGGTSVFSKNTTTSNATSSIANYDSIFNPSDLYVLSSSVFYIDSTSYYYVLGDVFNSGSIIVDGVLKIGGALYNSGSIIGTGSII